MSRLTQVRRPNDAVGSKGAIRRRQEVRRLESYIRAFGADSLGSVLGADERAVEELTVRYNGRKLLERERSRRSELDRALPRGDELPARTDEIVDKHDGAWPVRNERDERMLGADDTILWDSQHLPRHPGKLKRTVCVAWLFPRHSRDQEAI